MLRGWRTDMMHNSTLPRMLALAQSAAGLAVASKLLRAARRRIIPATTKTHDAGVTVLVPVLNEQARLSLCLEGAIQQGPSVTEILVIDGGSTDRTRELVAAYAARDRRVRLVDAAPIPQGWNGKAWGLEQGWRASNPHNQWILCLDADVYPAANLTDALVTFALAEHVSVLSVATQQVLPADPLAGLLHPAFLTTLIYRLGPPGSSTTNWVEAQANGQCMLIHRNVLELLGGFTPVAHSRCEDVTFARLAAQHGIAVGFFETAGLISARMHRNGNDVWHNWPRSLTLRDTLSGWRVWRDLLVVTLTQAVPLPLLLSLRFCQKRPSALTLVNGILLAIRLGTLWGARSAYQTRPWTYWLSPLCDPVVTGRLWQSALQRKHLWRGRILEGSV